MSTKANLQAKPTKQQRELMTQLVSHAAEFHSRLKISDSRPVLTGYRELTAVIIVPLGRVHTAEADPNIIKWLTATLTTHGCDAATIMYPIELHPVDATDATDSSERFGLLLEVQARGAPTHARIVEVTRREGGRNTFAPPIPVRGHNFGVVYPNLLNP